MVVNNPQPEKLLLDEFVLKTPQHLKHALEQIRERQLHVHNPVQFRFIESMADKALQYRSPVAEIITKKVAQALSNYLNDSPSQKKTTVQLNHKSVVKSELTKLTEAMLQSNNSEIVLSQLTFEDELKQQEKEIMHSMSEVSSSTATQNQGGHNDLSIMRQFRQSQVKHLSEQQLTRTIEEGPEDAGPLNSQALIIRSLTTMQELSPSYINRFVSYIDTLLWLEQADKEGTSRKFKKK
ncbi:MAG: DUF2894 domain-containing protein [Gammaproteobacteria bacterium]|nr:DUF2894 domain-containing protein [Gammaproteobacteria bacterium]